MREEAMPPFPVAERARYAALGYRIIEPAQPPCLLPRADWEPDSFVALKGDEVAISLIRATHPRNGAWKRLLRNLKSHRVRRVKVVCPLWQMKLVLTATGFSGPFHEGTGFMDRIDYWTKEL